MTQTLKFPRHISWQKKKSFSFGSPSIRWIPIHKLLCLRRWKPRPVQAAGAFARAVPSPSGCWWGRRVSVGGFRYPPYQPLSTVSMVSSVYHRCSYIAQHDRLNPIFHRVACLIDGNPHFQLGSIASSLHFSLHALGVSDDKLHECVFVVFLNSRKRILSSNI